MRIIYTKAKLKHFFIIKSAIKTIEKFFMKFKLLNATTKTFLFANIIFIYKIFLYNCLKIN